MPAFVGEVELAFFFFSSRRRHTRCGRDWSSDVCSSDLCGTQQWNSGIATHFLKTGERQAFDEYLTRDQLYVPARVLESVVNNIGKRRGGGTDLAVGQVAAEQLHVARKELDVTRFVGDLATGEQLAFTGRKAVDKLRRQQHCCLFAMQNVIDFQGVLLPANLCLQSKGQSVKGSKAAEHVIVGGERGLTGGK